MAPSPSPTASSGGGSCANSCYGETCDFWADLGYLCEDLETYSCDCAGCSCGAGDTPSPTVDPTSQPTLEPTDSPSSAPSSSPTQTPLPTPVPTTTLSPTTCWVVECGKVREVSGGAKVTYVHLR